MHSEKRLIPEALVVMERLERLLDRAEQAAGLLGRPEPPEEGFFRAAPAFRWLQHPAGGRFIPIPEPDAVDLDNLKGIDDAKAELLRNTKQFVAGHPANNVLLWGEKGTGKSSCVKGLLPLFFEAGLRVVEVRRDDLRWLPVMMEQVRRIPLRFILFCDDLSFQQPDQSYQELKALLEGGLEAPPENVLVYATSNRRHLLPEPMSDNTGGEIHPEEAVSEKLSLADRFGLQIGFYRLNQERYLAAVENYAALLNLPIGAEELRTEALRWAMFRGGRSGRAARQFIDDLAGRLALEKLK